MLYCLRICILIWPCCARLVLLFAAPLPWACGFSERRSGFPLTPGHASPPLPHIFSSPLVSSGCLVLLVASIGKPRRACARVTCSALDVLEQRSCRGQRHIRIILVAVLISVMLIMMVMVLVMVGASPDLGVIFYKTLTTQTHAHFTW